MKIIEIFDSIDGEGKRTGQPCSFIRLAGCNLRCSYCDTIYSLFGEDEECKYTEMSVLEVFRKVNPQYKRVTLTGGEPLIHRESAELVNLLTDNGFEVNIETNGAVDIESFLNQIHNRENLFFTIDYKLPSSKMSDKMLWNNFLCLRPYDVIKYVVGSDEDAKLMLDITKKLKNHYDAMPRIFVGAVYGMYEAQKLIDIILDEPCMANAQFQVQLHKIIWDPDKRGV